MNSLSQYAPLVRAMVRRYRGPGLEGEDLEQEAWLALVEARASYRPELNVPRSVYYKCRVRTALANVLRKYRRDGLYWRQEARVEEVPDRNEGFSYEMEDLVSRLPCRQGQVIRLYFCRQLTLREIADALGISISAVSTYKKRALAALARQESR